MCQPGLSLAVTLSVTVSPGLASAGSTARLRLASLGLARVELSFCAGFGGSSAARTRACAGLEHGERGEDENHDTNCRKRTATNDAHGQDPVRFGPRSSDR